MFCSLSRYLYPTNHQLRTLAGVPREKPKKGKHTENGRAGETFHVPRNLEITLESAEITALDVVHLKFYSEYQWLLDFSIYAGIVYVMTEVITAYSMYALYVKKLSLLCIHSSPPLQSLLTDIQ